MKKRLFLGIPVPASYQDTLTKSLTPLKQMNPHWRWVQKENYHVTICFIGEVETQTYQSVLPSINKIISNFSRFILLSNSIRLAPSKNPRMLWSGFEESSEFSDLVFRIESELSKKLLLPDYRKNNHPMPHITLARFPNDSIDQIALPDFRQTLPVETIDLFESISSEKGPYYRKAEEFTLRE